MSQESIIALLAIFLSINFGRYTYRRFQNLQKMFQYLQFLLSFVDMISKYEKLFVTLEKFIG